MNILENTKQGIFIPYVIGKGMVQVVNKNSIMKFFLGQPVVFCGFPKDWSLNLQVFMFCPGWIRLCISILEVWTGHRHVTEMWEGGDEVPGAGRLPPWLPLPLTGSVEPRGGGHETLMPLSSRRRRKSKSGTKTAIRSSRAGCLSPNFSFPTGPSRCQRC